MVGAVGVGVSGGCLGRGVGRGTEEPSNVRVGSKSFPEQRVLGYLAYHGLQSVEGIQVVNEIGYGNSRENWEATRTGIKDLYWEYTGTAWSRLPPRRDERIADPDRLYRLVSEDARSQGVRMASPASFSNGYVLIADRDWSERTGVTTISEFATHIGSGDTDFGLALNEDFYHRSDGWSGLVEYYGIGSEPKETLESGTFIITSVGITYELLREDRVQVASGFDTDPQLESRSFVTLRDDREYFLPYQPSPTAHAPTIEEHPGIFDHLRPIVSALDRRAIRRLTRRVIMEDESPSAVARSYLNEIGVVG